MGARPLRWAPTGLKNVMGQLDTLVIVILHMRSLGRFKYNVPQNYYCRGDHHRFSNQPSRCRNDHKNQPTHR